MGDATLCFGNSANKSLQNSPGFVKDKEKSVFNMKQDNLLSYFLLSPDVDECQAVLCAGGKTCSNSIGSYKCACRSGFTGANCQSSKYTFFILIDIVSSFF